MSMTPLELTLIGFLPALGFSFGAGRIVEAIKNGKYVKRELCDQIHKEQERRWSQLEQTLGHIREWMEEHK